MTSNRPTRSQRSLEFDPDAGEPRGVPEPQRGQSVSAAMKTTTLGPVSENLMEQIVDERNMERAWKKVKANRGAPGPDGVTLDEFFRTFRDQWPIVRQQLLDGTYEPNPARRKSIPKPDGSQRHLGIPMVSANYTEAQRGFGIDHDHPPFSSVARPAVSYSQDEARRRR